MKNVRIELLTPITWAAVYKRVCANVSEDLFKQKAAELSQLTNQRVLDIRIKMYAYLSRNIDK